MTPLRSLSQFLSYFLVPILVSPALFAWNIHPEPHEIEALGGSITWGAEPIIETKGEVSPAALQTLHEMAAKLPKLATPVQLIIGTRQSPEVATFLNDLPKISGAYRLRIDSKRVVLAGHDARGTYYAALTLANLLAKDNTVPAMDIRDWPEVADRGVVEGFYGTPWSHTKRLRVIEFLGGHKMDTYIYGPKDDPYHSSPKWRESYPAAEAEKIRELAATSMKHHVDFYWAIHPGKDIRWNDEDYNKALAKFESMYGLGVRAFAVFFDDISGEGTKADRQADLLNRLHRDFVVKKGDIRPLVMCPTQYNKAWSGGDYLDTLGTRLDPSIHVMWTGDTVVHDLDRESMEWINSKLQRKAYIWWNNPVTDYVRNHLLMGPIYGNDLDIGPLYGGFVSNPMERPEASRVALFGVADYTWNPAKFDPEASFIASMREILPGAPEAFETFCRHNADLGKNTHGYRRKESAKFIPIAEKFMATVREDKAADASAVRMEFEAIAACNVKIRATSDNLLLIGEMSPWLDAFSHLGRAGISALDALDAMQADAAKAWQFLAAAHIALDAMAEIDRTQNQNPYQPGVKTASLFVTPMVKELVEILDARLLAKLSGGMITRSTPSTSASERETLPLMVDGDDQSFAYLQQVQKAGDWFGLEFSAVKEVHRVRLLLGRNDNDHDRVHEGVLEGSVNGSWQTISKIAAARVDLKLDPPRTVRALRVRIIKPGSLAKPDLWTAVRAFEANPEGAAELRTDLPAYASQPVSLREHTYSISPSLEVHPFPPGKFLGLRLEGSAEVSRFEVDLKIDSPLRHFTLEAADSSGDWKSLNTTVEGTTMRALPATPVSAVRIRNQGRATPSVTLAKFALATKSTVGNPRIALSDGKLDAKTELPPGVSVSAPAGISPSEVVILLYTDWKGSATFQAIVGNRRQDLGSVMPPYARLSLPKGTTAIAVSSESPVPLYEIIWLGR